jgi:hypothetical protein
MIKSIIAALALTVFAAAPAMAAEYGTPAYVVQHVKETGALNCPGSYVSAETNGLPGRKKACDRFGTWMEHFIYDSPTSWGATEVIGYDGPKG